MVALLGGLIAALWLVPTLTKAKIGERCAKDADCRSQKCLVGDSIGGGRYPLYCTDECRSDRDCPSQMECDDGRSFRDIELIGTDVRICIRHEPQSP